MEHQELVDAFLDAQGDMTLPLGDSSRGGDKEKCKSLFLQLLIGRPPKRLTRATKLKSDLRRLPQ